MSRRRLFANATPHTLGLLVWLLMTTPMALWAQAASGDAAQAQERDADADADADATSRSRSSSSADKAVDNTLDNEAENEAPKEVDADAEQVEGPTELPQTRTRESGQKETLPANPDPRDEAIFGPADPNGDVDQQTPQPGDPDQAERARDEAIFGGEGVTSPDEDAETLAVDPETRDEAIFADGGPIVGGTSSVGEDIFERLEVADDPLAIGGRLFLLLNYNLPEDIDADNFTSPSLFDLYLDARPSPRVRGFLSGRLNYDFTRRNQPDIAASQPASLGFGLPQGPTNVQLDEMWIKFDIARLLYITAGRQHLRWGEGRFWNPTDFVNQARRDPLAALGLGLDLRLGLDLVKIHLPIESKSWNFYALAVLDNVQDPSDVGAGLRAEFLFGLTEVTLSTLVREQRSRAPVIAVPLGDSTLEVPIPSQEEDWPTSAVPVEIGLGLSSGLGPFDIRAELAVFYNTITPYFRGDLDLASLTPQALNTVEAFNYEDDWIVQTSLGGEWGVRYSDEDSFYLGAEYFFNSAGYDNPDLYPLLFLTNTFRPLYTGKHYAAVYGFLPGPGPFNESSFILTGLGNLSDRSFLARFDYSYQLHRFLTLNAYANYALGENGEFHFGFDPPQGMNAMQPASPLPAIPAPFLTVGAGLSMNF